jgi:NAD(P)-dependent dehydrogenase (short-subunit alcohol dehydrogenase family)
MRTSLITGGGSGIGLRLAELLAARGDRLAILDRTLTPEALERLGRAAPGDRLITAEVDVRDGDAVQAAVERCATAVGPPRLVINSAGIQSAKTFDEFTEAEFRQVVEST